MTQQKWQRETEALRAILVGCGLDEETKWGKPCFAFEGKNVAIIQAFKEHCALMFFKGVLIITISDKAQGFTLNIGWDLPMKVIGKTLCVTG